MAQKKQAKVRFRFVCLCSIVVVPPTASSNFSLNGIALAMPPPPPLFCHCCRCCRRCRHISSYHLHALRIFLSKTALLPSPSFLLLLQMSLDVSSGTPGCSSGLRQPSARTTPPAPLTKPQTLSLSSLKTRRMRQLQLQTARLRDKADYR